MPNTLTRREPRSRSNGSQPTEWNPIVVREGRARWRGGRAFWLALAYASFLSAVLWLSYSSSQGTRSPFLEAAPSPTDTLGAVAQLGHQLFSTLCYCQMGAWLLLAPLLTASALSGERQKGLLQGLLLSRLAPMQIVRGKWISALGLIALLQMAGLPVVAVCFVMGGVSPQEFVGALVIQLATACCGAAIGIVFSAQGRTNSDAASGAIVGVLAWLAGTGLAGVALSGYLPFFSEFAQLMFAANPIAAMVMMLEPTQHSSPSMPSGLWSVLFASGYGWALSPIGMGLIAAWCLKHASHILMLSPERLGQPGAAPSPASTYSALAEPIAAGQVEREGMRYAGNLYREPSVSRLDVRWEVPILKQVLFGSAMLRRELSHLWRWPAMSKREQAWVCVMLVFFGLMAFGALCTIFESANSAQGVWGAILIIYGVGGALLCAARPASSIAREREGGVWQSLNLTLLSPPQITRAKVAGPIVGAVGYGIGAWAFLLLAAWQGQVGLPSFLASVLVMLLAWAQVAAWSTLVGARTRVPQAAIGWGLGGPVFAWLVLPNLLPLLGLNSQSSLGFLQLLHPVQALSASTLASTSQTLLALTLHGALAAVLFALANRAVRISQRGERIGAAHTS